MDPRVYQVLHVLSAFLLVGGTFWVCAKPDPKHRKWWMMVTGILSLVMVVAGFALWGKLWGMQVSLWIILKLVCWFLLSGLAGLAYRLPGQGGKVALAAAFLAAVALVSVYVLKGA